MSGGRDGSSFTGTIALTRLALRRDRLLITMWTALIAFFVIVTVGSFKSLYPTAASRLPFAKSVETNSGLIALIGKPFDLTTTGGLTAWRIGSIAAILAAIMSYLIVVRHTRAEEENDRLELLRAQAIGVLAPLAAGVLAAAAANLVVAVVILAGMLATGVGFAGSLTLALAVASCGLVFGSLGAAIAQLTQTGRAANGTTSALLGLAFLLRAAGDGSSAHWLSWLSPVGWSQQVRAFAGDRWWVLFLPVALSLVLLGVAFRVAAQRDLGEGILANRPGPAVAADWLSTSGDLAWRLQRLSLLGWTIGFAVVGVVLGGLSGSVNSLVSGNQQVTDLVQDLGGHHGLTDAYLATMLGFSAIIASAYAVQAVLRLWSEESGGRAEPVLALPVRRWAWALGHLLLGLLGSLVLMVAVGLGMGIASGVDGGFWPQVARLTGAGLAGVPAVWVIGGLAMLLYGTAPRFSAAAWGLVLLAVLWSLVGPIAGFNHWILDLSPFTHTPKLPGGELHWEPLIWLTLIAAATSTAGLWQLTRRDLS